jgi:glucosamine-6-phosphate deaminase
LIAEPRKLSRMTPAGRAVQHAGMSVVVCRDDVATTRLAAERLVESMNAALAERGRAVVGLATGSTPERIYSQLVDWYRAHRLSFRNVLAYNLDEYYPISPFDPRSYRSYMHRNLFSHVDIAPNRAHVFDGTVPEEFAMAHAAEFEGWIAADGGLDVQLLGIGRNGHIAFNEPSDLTLSEALRLPARVVELHPATREVAARDFGGLDRVIPRALTLGTAAILAARAIVIVATGAHKADAVRRALEGPMTARLPASLLQSVAAKVTWLLDEPAASALGC